LPKISICAFLSSEFALDEAGDIRWKLHQTPSDYLPFLTCDSYELANCPDCKVILHCCVIINIVIVSDCLLMIEYQDFGRFVDVEFLYIY
jgi:hypothetical protein